MDAEEKLKQLRKDPVVFARTFLRLTLKESFNPYPYQEKILRDKSKRLVACLGRQTGKTTTIAGRALHFAFTNSSTTTLIVSPSLRQSMIMFDRILGFIYMSKSLRKSVVRKTRTIIQFTNGAQIVALPCSENLLRGYTANMVICDEAAFMPEEVISSVLFPMLATTEGALVLLSTPWGRDNLFYRAFMDPRWSAYRVKSSESPKVTSAFLEEQRRLLTKEEFEREYEAEFSEAATSYFSQDLIRSCVSRAQGIGLEFEDDVEKFATSGCFAGVDLGKKQDFSVISAVQADGGLLKLVFHKQFPLETPYPEIVGAITRLHQHAPFQKVVIDRSGIGEAILDELHGLPAEGVAFTEQSKAGMLGAMRVAMERGNLAIPYDRELCGQINEQRYEYTKSGKLKFWHPENAHDDMLWALALAIYATRGGGDTSPPIAISG